MLFASIAPIFAALALHADTTVVIGSRSIDLTGDGRPETLLLIGTGASIDSLAVTFEVMSSGRVLFSAPMLPLTRVEGYDGPRRVRSRAEQLAFLRDVGHSWFVDSKFSPASDFVEELGSQAPGRVSEIQHVIAMNRAAKASLGVVGGLELGHVTSDSTGVAIWNEILKRNPIVFSFSPGGDLATAIAWSERDQRFYKLMECC